MLTKKFVSKAKKPAKAMMGRKNVVGAGAGHKWKDGHKTEQEAVVVLVKKKVAADQLTKEDLLPKTVEVDGKEVPVDVIEVGELRALNAHTYNYRPLVAGVSCGHYMITAGTLGIFVEKNGKPYILSNNHVLADSNAAQLGDAIYQPGPIDGGRSRHTVAHLSEFVPISFTARNYVDCALAELVGYDVEPPVDEPLPPGDDPTDPTHPTEPPAPVEEKKNWFEKIIEKIVNFFKSLFGGLFGKAEKQSTVNVNVNTGGTTDDTVAPSEAIAYSNLMLNMAIPLTGNLAEVAVGDQVQKSGRTTGYTQGEILALGATVEIDFGNGQYAMFENQIIADNMSAGGDSGSVIFNMNGDAVGLLFAGSDAVTIMNPIKTVFTKLGIDRIIV